ncbi:unnamed protein product [Linum trigynum]|uniref:DUF4283 domain-containing protein n=1 Tax=Linum trigynum TaxID=586398 RepID=A0AAV2GPG1_9ROSI
MGSSIKGAPQPASFSFIAFPQPWCSLSSSLLRGKGRREVLPSHPLSAGQERPGKPTINPSPCPVSSLSSPVSVGNPRVESAPSLGMRPHHDPPPMYLVSSHITNWPSSLMQENLMDRAGEDQVVKFNLDEVQSPKFRASRTLLGRIFTGNQLTNTELRDELSDAWQMRGHLRVLRTKHGLIEIVLPSEESKIWVLKRTPWVIKDKLINLRSWTSMINKQIFDDLVVAPFRIQL